VACGSEAGCDFGNLGMASLLRQSSVRQADGLVGKVRQKCGRVWHTWLHKLLKCDLPNFCNKTYSLGKFYLWMIGYHKYSSRSGV
jgi:hypothetical protein